MKIGIDVRCFAKGKKTGVEEYALNLLEHLFALDQKNTYVLFFNSFRKPKDDFSWATRFPNVRLKQFRIPNKLINFFFWYFEWPKIDKLIGGVDVFFMPNITFGSFSYRNRLVVTIHDLSFECHPETFSSKRRWWHMFIHPKLLAKKARRVIAVSESTKKDLVHFYGIPAEKVQVVYSGVADQFQPLSRNDATLVAVKERYRLPYKFILYLGTIEPRKNIVGIVRAYEQLRREKNPELAKHKLVIAGTRGWKYSEILEAISSSSFREDIILTGYIQPEHKAALYNLASLFVYPSFFEGFGFPVVEAMKCKTPVVTSNTSSLPELVGGSGLMIDPDKPDELAIAMREILLKKNLSDRFAEKGLLQAKQFSWKKAAKEVLEILEVTGRRKK